MEKTLKEKPGPNATIKKSASIYEAIPLKYVPKAIAYKHKPIRRHPLASNLL